MDPVFVTLAADGEGSDWLDWLGIFISLGTLLVIACTLVVQKQSARNSIQPAFSVWAEYPRSDSRSLNIYVSNKGFGPAVVLDFKVFYKDDPGVGFSFEKVSDVIKKAFSEEVNIARVSALDRGHAMGAGDIFEIASFEPPYSDEAPTPLMGLVPQDTDELSDKMADITLVVRYKDILNRPWYFVTYRFEGYTFRDFCFDKDYRLAKKRFGHILVKARQ